MEPPSTSSNVTVLNRTRRPLRREIVRRAVAATLDAHGTRRDVEVLLEESHAIRELNLKFRNVDSDTDVLSFPGGDFHHSPLGEVAISVPFAARQAEMRKAKLHDELALLAIHGTLHLLGMDDENENDRLAMVRTMNDMARRAGLTPDDHWYSRLKEQTE